MIFFQLLIIIFSVYCIFVLAYAMFKGAPYAPVGKKRMNDMFKLLNPEKGKKLVDVGSGDGRIVIEAAKKGLQAYGMEINPVLYLVAIFKIKRLKLQNSKILLCDLWSQDFSDYDYITIYGTGHLMARFEKKFYKKLKKDTKIVSNHFQFPNWKPVKKLGDAYLYIKE